MQSFVILGSLLQWQCQWASKKRRIKTTRQICKYLQCKLEISSLQMSAKLQICNFINTTTNGRKIRRQVDCRMQSLKPETCKRIIIIIWSLSAQCRLQSLNPKTCKSAVQQPVKSLNCKKVGHQIGVKTVWHILHPFYSHQGLIFYRKAHCKHSHDTWMRRGPIWKQHTNI